MQQQPQFPIGNRPSATGQVPSSDETALVDKYATQILTIRRKVAHQTLEMAAIISEAVQNLSRGGQKELASRIGMSPATISKYKKIHEARERFEGRVDDLPPEPSTLYALAKVSPDDYQQMTDDGLVRPDLTAKAIEEFVSQSSSETAPARNSSGGKLETLAILKCPVELGMDKRRESLSIVKRALSGGPIAITEPASPAKSKTKVRQDLAATLHKELEAELAVRRPTEVSPEEYQALENAAWQHWHKRQKGNYPYSSDESNSIENPDHPYSVHGRFSTDDLYFAHLAEQRIITSYSPPAADPTSARANCLRLAIDICEAATKKARETYYGELEEFCRSDSSDAASVAEECMDRLRKGGAV